MECQRKPDIIERVCLKCREKFRSKSIGNRVCVKCNKDNIKTGNVMEVDLLKFIAGINGRRIKKEVGIK